MKILQVVHSFLPQNMAGTEIYTYNLSKELSKKNEVFVFYRVNDFRKREYELNYDKFNGLNIITVNNTFKFCNSFEKFYRNDIIAEQFAKVLDKIKPHIVHIQHFIFLSTTIIDEIKRRGIPVVFTLHDYWLICPQWHFLKKDLGICNDSDESKCVDCLDYQLSIKRFPKSIYVRFRNIIPGFATRFLKNIYLNMAKADLNSQDMPEKIRLRIKHIKGLSSKVDLFIAPSQFLRKKFIEFGIPEDKTRFIPHGINTEYFKGFKRKPSDRMRFGFIGTILPAKGVDILIEAFNRIKDERIELKIYGRLFPYRGFEYYPSHIRRLTRNKKVKFMGGFDHKDVANIFSEIDVLVFPSIWNENCPLVILEAIITKTPVIASKIGGIPELVKDGLNGVLFNPKDVDELQEKIQYVINPDTMGKLQEAAPEVTSIEDHANKIENLYECLIQAYTC